MHSSHMRSLACGSRPCLMKLRRWHTCPYGLVAGFVLHTRVTIDVCREDQDSSPRRACILASCLVGGLCPTMLLRSAPAVGVRFSPELGMLLLAVASTPPVRYKPVAHCLNNFVPLISLHCSLGSFSNPSTNSSVVGFLCFVSVLGVFALR